jgi:hypothetical protein
MHHLHIVAGTLIANPLTACLAVALGRNTLEDIFDVWPGLFIPTRHNRRSVTGTLLAAGNATANEPDALTGQFLGPSIGIREIRVATVDNDVTALEKWQKLLDPIVYSRTGLNEEHDTAWPFELGNEVLNAVRADDGLSLGLIGQESIDLGDCSIESADCEAVICHVHDEILAPGGHISLYTHEHDFFEAGRLT